MGRSSEVSELKRFGRRAAEQAHAPDRGESACHLPPTAPLRLMIGGVRVLRSSVGEVVYGLPVRCFIHE